MMFFMNRYKDAALESVRYSYGGDMMGSYQSAELKDGTGGKATLTVERREYHSARMVTTTYEVSGDELEKIRELMLEYDQVRGSKRPRSKIEVMDEGTAHLSFRFAEGYVIDLNSDLDLKAKQSEGFRIIRDYLFGLAGEGTLISQETEERQIRLALDGYTEIFNIRNGVTEEDCLKLGGDHEITSYGDNEKIFYPEEKLDVSGLEPAVSGAPGTLAYYEPWGDVVIFYGEFRPAEGLYELGSLTNVYNSTLELLAGMEGTYRFYAYSE